MKEYIPLPGRRLADASLELADQLSAAKEPMKFVFNGVEVIVNPDHDAKRITELFWAEARRREKANQSKGGES